MTETTRRGFLRGTGLVAGAALAGGLAGAAQAQNVGAARALVEQVVRDVLQIINSGRSESAMIQDFRGIFSRYGDVPVIARSVLGPPARSASAGQLAAFTDAFEAYMARKYGRRFREFIGGQIVVNDARPVRSFVEVVSTVTIRGQAPFEVRWLVSDGSGRPRFFNMIIEGVNLMITERSEIGAMLEARRGDIDRLTADLRGMG